MEKKKWFIITITIVVIISIVSYVACSRGEKEKIPNGSVTEIYSYLPSEYSIDKMSKDTLSYKILEKTYIEKTSETYSGETGDLVLQVSTPDFISLIEKEVKALGDVNAVSFDEQKKKVQENMMASLENNDYPKKETTVNVKVKKEDGKWKIEPNDEFADAISGHMMGGIKELLGKED